jgi:hypothetical protein
MRERSGTSKKICRVALLGNDPVDGGHNRHPRKRDKCQYEVYSTEN